MDTPANPYGQVSATRLRQVSAVALDVVCFNFVALPLWVSLAGGDSQHTWTFWCFYALMWAYTIPELMVGRGVGHYLLSLRVVPAPFKSRVRLACRALIKYTPVHALALGVAINSRDVEWAIRSAVCFAALLVLGYAWSILARSDRLPHDYLLGTMVLGKPGVLHRGFEIVERK